MLQSGLMKMSCTQIGTKLLIGAISSIRFSIAPNISLYAMRKPQINEIKKKYEKDYNTY